MSAKAARRLLAPSKRIVLSLDADDAGRRAVERLAEKELPALSAQGVDVRVTSLPEGFKDPDEYVRAHGGCAFVCAEMADENSGARVGMDGAAGSYQVPPSAGLEPHCPWSPVDHEIHNKKVWGRRLLWI